MSSKVQTKQEELKSENLKIEGSEQTVNESKIRVDTHQKLPDIAKDQEIQKLRVELNKQRQKNTALQVAVKDLKLAVDEIQKFQIILKKENEKNQKCIEQMKGTVELVQQTDKNKNEQILLLQDTKDRLEREKNQYLRVLKFRNSGNNETQYLDRMGCGEEGKGEFSRDTMWTNARNSESEQKSLDEDLETFKHNWGLK